MDTQLTANAKTASALSATPKVRWVTPPVDVFDKEDSILVIADIPGVSRDALTVEVDGRALVFSGLRTETHGYRRRIEVPRDVDSSGIEAALVDGVLTLTLPRREELKRRTITVA